MFFQREVMLKALLPLYFKGKILVLYTLITTISYILNFIIITNFYKLLAIK